VGINRAINEIDEFTASTEEGNKTLPSPHTTKVDAGLRSTDLTPNLSGINDRRSMTTQELTD
jgi:hypothetical protein